MCLIFLGEETTILVGLQVFIILILTMELLYKETLRSLFTNAKLNVQLVQPIMQLLKEEFALHVLLDGL